MKTLKSENKGQQAPHPKHVPQRSCVACRQTRDKRDLVRLVLASGQVEVDLKGRQPGRGVYLCPQYDCWAHGLKGSRIEYGLRSRMSAENRAMLLEYALSLAPKRN